MMAVLYAMNGAQGRYRAYRAARIPSNRKRPRASYTWGLMSLSGYSAGTQLVPITRPDSASIFKATLAPAGFFAFTVQIPWSKSTSCTSV